MIAEDVMRVSPKLCVMNKNVNFENYSTLRIMMKEYDSDKLIYSLGPREEPLEPY